MPEYDVLVVFEGEITYTIGAPDRDAAAELAMTIAEAHIPGDYPRLRVFDVYEKED